MKYKYFTLVLLALSCLFGHIAFAGVDEFDAKQLTPWWLEGIPEPALVQEVELLDEELTVLNNNKIRYESMEQRFIASQQAVAADLATKQKVLADLESMRREIQANIKKHSEEASTIDEDLTYLTQELSELEKKQAEGNVLLKKTIASSYIDSIQARQAPSLSGVLLGGVFGEQMLDTHSQSLLRDVHESLLTKQKNFEENLNNLRSLLEKKSVLKKRNLERLSDYESELQETQELQEEIVASTATKHAVLGTKIDTVARRKAVLEEKIAKKILAVTEKKESMKVEYEQKVIQYENLLAKRAGEYGCATKKTTLCTWIQKYVSAEKELKNTSKEQLTFHWPVSPENGFGYHFRDQAHYLAFASHHNGLDILSSVGTEVYAMEDGYILLQQAPSSKSPGMVAIKHNLGYITVYLGLVPAKQALFTQIKQGDTIGKTRKNLGNFGKNNLHVEMYVNEKLIDPMEQLDTSALTPDIIPKRYSWKYIDDIKKTGGNPDIESLQKSLGFFYIPGANERERQENLLAKYAAADFQDKTVWIEASITESIDPTFILCIGLAESSLGNNLTTPGNIGNVGNTDGGARKNYNSPVSGIHAISKVLNNTWLGSYVTVDQLSGWGNTKGPIYASSPTNWHENIIKCMSAIKGRYVGNQATFRLTQANLLIYQQEGFGSTVNS